LKLIEYDLLKRSDGRISALIEASADASKEIAARVAADLVKRLSMLQAWSCISITPGNGAVTLDAMTLPLMHDGLGLWLTEFGVARRDRIEARHWLITSTFSDLFWSGVKAYNTARPRRAKSAERLEADLAQQAANGELAEIWVVDYERRRLASHPLRDQIRRISPDDVSAGYDVVSFASLSSMTHDLFIEVKSHGENKFFHWSRNEIATAEEFGEEYALYLVDRTRMHELGYTPHVITAPSPEIFLAPGSGWRVEATSFEHIAIEG
jgi:hypothetical protein